MSASLSVSWSFCFPVCLFSCLYIIFHLHIIFLLNVELESEPHAHHTSITVHIKPDLGGELIPIAGLHLHCTISELNQVLEANMHCLREYHYYLKHKNEVLCHDYPLEYYGIKNQSVIELHTSVRRKKISSFPVLCGDHELESLHIEAIAAEPLSSTRSAVAKPHCYEKHVRRVEIVDSPPLVKTHEMYPERCVLHDQSLDYYGMLDPTRGAIPHETHYRRVAVADQPASYVIEDSTSQTRFPMKGDFPKLKVASSKVD